MKKLRLDWNASFGFAICFLIYASAAVAYWSTDTYHRQRYEPFTWNEGSCLIQESRWSDLGRKNHSYDRIWNVRYEYQADDVTRIGTIARMYGNSFRREEEEEISKTHLLGHVVPCYINPAEANQVTLLRIDGAEFALKYAQKMYSKIFAFILILGPLLGFVAYKGIPFGKRT